MVNLTVIILTKNEEKNIKKCIESLNGIAKRIVIADSFSTDKTAEIAASLGADVYKHEFKNHADQFNWALDNTNIQTEWIMRLDADEQLTDLLVNEINSNLDELSKDICGVIVRRRMMFMGKWIKHGGRYPEFLLRLFRRGKGRCEMKQMDEHCVIFEGKTITFKNDLIDNNQKDLTWWIAKHNWYSSREVLDYQQHNCVEIGGTENEGSMSSKQAQTKRKIKNTKYYKLPKFLRAHLYFIYRYYFRFGFLDGKEGKIYHFLQAYWYRFLVDAKIYECEKYNITMEEQGDLKA